MLSRISATRAVYVVVLPERAYLPVGDFEKVAEMNFSEPHPHLYRFHLTTHVRASTALYLVFGVGLIAFFRLDLSSRYSE